MQFSLQMDKIKHASSLQTVCGFASLQAFLFSVLFLGENRALVINTVVFERVNLFLILLFIQLAFMLMLATSSRARDSLLSRPLLWAYVCLLVLGSSLSFILNPQTIGVVLESLIIGTPVGFLIAAWGRALGSRPSELFVAEVFIAGAVAAVFSLCVVLIPISQATLLFSFLPILSVFLLVNLEPFSNKTVIPAQKNSETHTGLTFGDLFVNREEHAETTRLSRKIVAGTTVFGLTAGFMSTYMSNPGMEATPSFWAIMLLLALFSLGSLQLLSSGFSSEETTEESGPLDSVYRLSILIMMAGFFFVPILGSYNIPGESITFVGYLGLTYVLTSLFLLTAKLTGQDPARSCSRGFARLYLGQMIGILLGNVIESVDPVGQAASVIVAAAGLAALYAFLFLFTERDFRALSVIVSNADRFDDACKKIVQEFGLSKRESEVLPLALRGRTGERIAAELFITKSTVDTHLRRIYAKTGMHGRQELIDLGERIIRKITEGEK